MKSLKKYKYTIALCVLIVISVFIAREEISIFKLLSRIAFSSIFVVSYISFSASIKNRILSTLLHFIGAVIYCFVFIYLILYKQSITYDVIASILTTDSQEIFSYFVELSYVLIIPLFLVIIYFISGSELRNKPLISVRKSILLMIIATILPIAISMTRSLLKLRKKNYATMISDFKFSYALGVNEKLGEDIHLLNTYNVFGLLFYGNAVYLESLNLKQYYKRNKVRESGIELVTDKDIKRTPNTIVLVVGESASLFHLSVYGYEKKTTPFLDSIYNKTNLSSKYDAITAFQYTRTAVPSLLTVNNAISTESTILDIKNNIHLAKDLGYKTYWISNQNRSGKYEGEITLLANTCDHLWFSSTDERKEDFNLIQPFSEYYQPSQKQLFILHLIGSHVSFYNKYDKEDAKKLSDQNKVEQYDCTIHHTDRFLRKVHNVIEESSQANYAMIYLSDHGENPYSLEGRYSKDGYSFYVPFITISNKYKNKLDSICTTYISDKYFNTSNTYYVFAELLGYTVSEEVRQKARESGNFISFMNGSEPYSHYTKIPLENIESALCR